MLTDLDLHAVMLQELRSLTGPRRDEVIDARDAYQHIIEATISDARAAGVLRTDFDVKYLTLSLGNLLNWTMSWYKPDGDLSPSEIATMLANIYLDGAAQRSH
jgi:hypothetical protein